MEGRERSDSSGTSASSSTGNPLAHGHLPTPVLERMAHRGSDSSWLASPSWWNKFSLGGDRARDSVGTEQGSSESRELEEGRVPLLPDPNGRAPEAENSTCCRRKHGWRTRTVVFCCVPASIIVFVLCTVLGLYAFIPRFGQTVMDQSTLTVVRMHMKDPTEKTITLSSDIELHDVGEVSSTMLRSQVQVIHEGVVLAEMELPEMDIVGGQVLKFTLESLMTVKNISAFTQATAKILQGHGGVWFIKGKPLVEVSVLGFTKRFHVDLYKRFDVPATLLEDVRGKNTKVLAGQNTVNSFNISSTTTFFSSSILELYHLGLFVFDLLVLVDTRGELMGDYSDLSAGKLIKIGRVIMEDFDLRQGVNQLQVVGQVIKTKDNVHVLSAFVSNFMNGLDQTALIKGPTIAASPFLDDVVVQHLIFEGMRDQPIDGSYIDKSTLIGFSTHIPGQREAVHYRGTKVFAHNPLDAPIAQRNITTRVLFSEPLGYILKSELLGEWTCETSNQMGELYSAPGMFQHQPDKPPVIHMPPHERITFFLPGRPLKDQIKQKPCTIAHVPVAGDYDCCMVSVQTAAACRARSKDMHATSFDVDTTTWFTLVMGAFELDLVSEQRNVPTVFDDQLTKGFPLDAELKCSDFEFLP